MTPYNGGGGVLKIQWLIKNFDAGFQMLNMTFFWSKSSKWVIWFLGLF